MPARGDGLAMLKWISSFPGNPERGLPTVMGVVVLSDAQTSAPLALLDARSVTALRTGAVAAVAARALAVEGASTCGIVGCGLHGAWAARCLVAEGYGGGRLPRPARGGGRGAGGRARRRLARRDARGRAGVRRRHLRDAGRGAGRRRRRPAPRPAPEHARRRRPGQGRGDDRGRRRLRPLLRRVGAGVARRRAHRRRRGRARHARATSSTSAPCWPARRRAPPASGPRSSTRPAWRSRTSRSRRRCGAREALTLDARGMRRVRGRHGRWTDVRRRRSRGRSPSPAPGSTDAPRRHDSPPLPRADVEPLDWSCPDDRPSSAHHARRLERDLCTGHLRATERERAAVVASALPLPGAAGVIDEYAWDRHPRRRASHVQRIDEKAGVRTRAAAAVEPGQPTRPFPTA